MNPIAAPLAVMRSSLVGSLVANVRFNANRKAARVRMFEIAKVYRRDASVVDGRTRGRRYRAAAEGRRDRVGWAPPTINGACTVAPGRLSST